MEWKWGLTENSEYRHLFRNNSFRSRCGARRRMEIRESNRPKCRRCLALGETDD